MSKLTASNSVANSFLAGLTTDVWLKLLKQSRPELRPIFMGRMAFITLMSLYNSLYLRREKQYNSAVSNTQIKAPLFILGHWRSGTTHLHNLLALDNNFAYPNLYQITNPRTFLSSESFGSRLISSLVPETRSVDNVRLTLQDTPQEDEFALLLTTLKSPYLGYGFPNQHDYYDKYLTFDNVSPTELQEWEDAFVWFLKKLTLKYRRPIILKSPPHTARINLLLQIFPDARFVHIHRDPLTVFQSMQHLYNVNFPDWTLQHPVSLDLDDYILKQYTELYDSFFEHVDRIPQGQFCEIAFSALESNPISEIGFIYDSLGLDNFYQLEPRLKQYLATISDYKKNHYPILSEQLQQRVRRDWQRSFDMWKYPTV